MKKIILLLILPTFFVYGQTEEIPKPANFSIPSSPAFDLLQVNPSLVNKPGFLRDFKVDWVLSDFSLAPDIAIEAQPAWLFFFKNVDRIDYLRMSHWLKSLSTLSVSLATVKGDTLNSIAFSAKINIYRESDPISDYKLIEKLVPSDDKETRDSILRLNSIELQLMDETITVERKKELEQLRDELNKFLELDEKEKKEIEQYKKNYYETHWNDNLIDVGYGRLEHYQPARIDSLSFLNGGNAVWLNLGIGIGESVFLNSLARYTNFSRNDVWLGGVNFRYGSSSFNFFIEYVYESMDKIHDHIIGYGGDYKFNNSILIQFGLRTDYSKSMKLKNFKPVVNVSFLFDQ